MAYEHDLEVRTIHCSNLNQITVCFEDNYTNTMDEFARIN